MVVLPLLLITACGDDPENEGNHLPTVSIDNKNQTVDAGEEAKVTAKAIDVDGDSLTYLWKMKSKPNDSEAQLSNSRTKRVSLLTDKSGDYVLSFVANDGLTDSKTVTATIHANAVVPDDKEDSNANSDDNGDKDESQNHDVISNKTGIVGAWTLDIPKADAIINSYGENDPTALFLALMITSIKDIQFKEDGTCAIPGMDAEEKRKKCWESNDDGYTFYSDKGKSKAEIELDDNDNILKIKFEESENTKAMDLEYTRVDESTLVPPSVVMKKDRVYHARDIEMKIFHVNGSGYFLFTGDNDFYHLSTEKLNSLSLEELKEIKAKDERNEGGFLIETGAYQVNKGYYSVKNNAFYTGIAPFSENFNEKKIEIIDANHIKFGGYDYYLE